MKIDSEHIAILNELGKPKEWKVTTLCKVLSKWYSQKSVKESVKKLKDKGYIALSDDGLLTILDNITPKKDKTLTSVDKDVIQLLSYQNTLSVAELSRKLGIDKHRVEYRIQQLLKIGAVIEVDDPIDKRVKKRYALNPLTLIDSDRGILLIPVKIKEHGIEVTRILVTNCPYFNICDKKECLLKKQMNLGEEPCKEMKK